MVAGVRIVPPSPCINVCTLDDATGWCLGCGRTMAEIADWSAGDPARLADIRRELPARMAELAGRGAGPPG